MKADRLFWAICQIDEDLILEAKEDVIVKQRRFTPLRVALIAAAVALLLAGAAFGVYQYTRSAQSLADRWETLGETEMPEAQMEYIESKSATIGESVTDSGFSISLDSVTCTEDRVYLTIEVQPEREDSEVYDYVFTPEIQVDHPDLGGVEAASRHPGIRKLETMEGYWTEVAWRASDLPDGMRLNDGKAVMRMEIHELYPGTAYGVEPDTEPCTGNWVFEFTLPEGEPSESIGNDAEVSFDNGIVLWISALSLDETSVCFSVETDNEEYVFTGSGVQAELARAAEPDVPFFTVEAKLSDGTVIPTIDVGMTWDEATDLDEWTIDWAAPVDPEEIVALVFSDGETEVEVPLV